MEWDRFIFTMFHLPLTFIYPWLSPWGLCGSGGYTDIVCKVRLSCLLFFCCWALCFVQPVFCLFGSVPIVTELFQYLFLLIILLTSLNHCARHCWKYYMIEQFSYRVFLEGYLGFGCFNFAFSLFIFCPRNVPFKYLVVVNLDPNRNVFIICIFAAFLLPTSLQNVCLGHAVCYVPAKTSAALSSTKNHSQT